MALYSTLQKFITKEGAPVEGASVNVKLSGGFVDAELFATRTGTAKSNPFLTTANGEALCYVKAGRYDMTVTKGTDQIAFKDVEVGPVSNVGTFSEGGTITDPDQLVEDSDGNKWRWTGNLNYTFAAGENPNSIDEWSRYIDFGLPPFKTVAAMKAYSNLKYFSDGTRVEWQGYYTQSDGGGNWGALRFGTHTEDGGSIFSIDANTYIEANLKGGKINVRKFGCMPSMDGTSGMISALSFSRNAGNVVYVPADRDNEYIVNAQMDATGSGIVGDGRELSVIKTNSGNAPAILHRGGPSSGRKFVYLKGIQFLNNGGTGDCIEWNLSPRHNFISDIKVFGYYQGAAIKMKEQIWISDMDDVYLDNCKYGLFFERAVVGDIGGSHTYRGGAIEGCQRAVEGEVKNLAFYGTTIEGHTGVIESFSDGNAVGGVCLLKSGEGPIAFHDCWMEGNALPAIITGVGATSEESATSQITVNGGRHQFEKLIWIRGNTSQISIRDINFGWASSNRNAIIWVDNRNARVHIENIRYNKAYQSVYDAYTFNLIPKTTMFHEGGQVIFRQNSNGDVFSGIGKLFARVNTVDPREFVFDVYTEGGSNRTF